MEKETTTTRAKIGYAILSIAAFAVGMTLSYHVLTHEPGKKPPVAELQQERVAVKEPDKHKQDARKTVDEQIAVAKAALKYLEASQQLPADIGALTATGLLQQGITGYNIEAVNTANGPAVKITSEVSRAVCNSINHDIAKMGDPGDADLDLYPVHCEGNTAILVVGTNTAEQPPAAIDDTVQSPYTEATK